MKGLVYADICHDFPPKNTTFKTRYIPTTIKTLNLSTGLGTAADSENVRVSNKDLRSYQ